MDSVKIIECFPGGRIELLPSGSISGRAVHGGGFKSALYTFQYRSRLIRLLTRNHLSTYCVSDTVLDVEYSATKRQIRIYMPEG